ncbi:MAG: hypothetical protein WCD37_04860 [Chloroflexia bacterium]
MNSYREIAKNRRLDHLRLAQVALQRYGLLEAGASASLISDAEHAVFKVSVPAEMGAVFHPYLGRIEGKQFLLRIEDTADRRLATTYSELALLAAMLRETDLALPEPVPAMDGALVPELCAGEDQDGEEFKQCVLFRWAGLPFPEAALNYAGHWQEN